MATRPPFRIALVGECMVEMKEGPDGSLSRGFGGDTFNTAVYLARLGHKLGPFVDYVSAVGDDAFSAEMLACCGRNGVGTRHVLIRCGMRPGLYVISVDAAGERRFTYWRGEAAVREAFEGEGSDGLLEALGTYDLVYVSGISLAVLKPPSRERLLRRLEDIAAAGVAVAFDCNHRPQLWRSDAEACDAWKRVFAIARYLMATVEELTVLAKGTDVADLVRDLSQQTNRELVVKDGASPCLVASDGQVHTVAATPVEHIVDTTAAGDSFSAAYLLGRLLGLDVRECARRAHILAARVITHPGAIIPLDAMPDLFTDRLPQRVESP